jgi:hypothetical protein
MTVSRAELDALFAEDDKLRASHREWMAEREAAREALERKSGSPDDLVFKTMEDALQLAPKPDSEAADDDLDAMTVLDEFSAAAVERFRRLDNELAYLRGQLDVALVALGLRLGNVRNENNSKSADIVDLPPFLRQRNDGAA